MDIPHAEWYRAIRHRRSRRSYDGVPLEPETIERLRTVCREFRPFPEVRSEVIEDDPDKVLRGILGSYGKIKGAPALIAFVGRMDDPHVQEKLGYTGEGIILEATSMGLGTCWVGGFFRPRVAGSLIGLTGKEKVVAVTPVGRMRDRFSREERVMTGFGLMHRRKSLAALTGGADMGLLPEWAKAALEAARIAPSAVNRQPWRCRADAGSITVSVDSPGFDISISRRLDCGIAMLHIEVAALEYGVQGRWEFLSHPGVARFTVQQVPRDQTGK
ncbi:MAG: nitroreductase family protein [Dehalococcoidia bacterium]|nr:nitroreductase family protein [Dehalococcoidia bacterium]